MRTIVELTEEQLARLAVVCERENISRAEAVRRGVELLLEQQDDSEAKFLSALDSAFGTWKDYGIDGVKYQRELRAEWDRGEK